MQLISEVPLHSERSSCAVNTRMGEKGANTAIEAAEKGYLAHKKLPPPKTLQPAYA